MQEPFSFLNLSSGYFIVGSFPGQERPSSSDTGPVEWRAVIVFPIAIEVVPVPNRACLGLFS